MMTFDWSSVVLGLAIGAMTSAVFFAGLAWGMRLALRSKKTVSVLVLSAAVRIFALIGIGSIVAGLGGVWSLLGYAVAFICMRFITTTVVSVGAAVGDAK